MNRWFDARFESFLHKSSAKLKKIRKFSRHKVERMAAHAILMDRRS